LGISLGEKSVSGAQGTVGPVTRADIDENTQSYNMIADGSPSTATFNGILTFSVVSGKMHLRRILYSLYSQSHKNKKGGLVASK
jgi:hypothetical protein